MAAKKKIKPAAKKLTKTKAPAKAAKARRPAAKAEAQDKEKLPPVALLQTGSSSFDKLLGGGIEEGSSLLVIGTPHCGKKPVLMNLAHAECRRGRPAIFILTDIGASTWSSMMNEGGWECDNVKNRVFFIDCYSQQFGACSNSETVTCIEVPFSMSAVSIEVSNLVEKAATASRKKPVIIFHSLSTLIELFGEEEAYRFVQFFVGKFRTAGITTVLSLQMGVHSPRIESAFTTLADGLIEMKDGEIRASGYRRIPNKGWVSYSIVNGKIKLDFPEEQK